MTLPDGEKSEVALDPMRPVFFAATEQAGPYLVEKGDKVEHFAVNLASMKESSITPAATLNLGRAEIKATAARAIQDMELWRWIIMAALLVLIVEWWIYSRRAWM